MTHTPTEIAAMIERLERKTFENDGYHGVFEVNLNPDGPDAAAMLREVAAERDALAVAEQNAFNQRNMALDELKLAEAERDRLAAMVEKLKEVIRQYVDPCDVKVEHDELVTDVFVEYQSFAQQPSASPSDVKP